MTILKWDDYYKLKLYSFVVGGGGGRGDGVYGSLSKWCLDFF